MISGEAGREPTTTTIGSQTTAPSTGQSVHVTYRVTKKNGKNLLLT